MSSKTLNVCVVRNKEFAVSETFIELQIRLLPHRVEVVFGPRVPEFVKTPGGAVPLSDNPDDLRSGRAFEQFLNTNGIDVVLAHFGHVAHRIVPHCQRASVPLVAHFHGYDAYQHDVRNETDGFGLLFESAAGLIVPSHHMQLHLTALGAPAHKIHLVRYGISDDFFTLPPTRSSEKIQCLSVGRFVDKKGPQLTVLAFAKALAAVPTVTLTMAGEGYLLESCKQLIRALNIERSVSFPGAVTHTEVLRHLARSGMFIQHSVVTSYGDAEGLPVAILEAMASAVPVVATNHTGIPEMVLHRETGLLSAERAIDEMADNIRLLCTDKALRNSLGVNARKHSYEKCRQQHSTAGLSTVLEQAAR